MRQKHSFWEMCHCPELIAEVTQMPIRRYGFDAAILFSDILIVLPLLGRAVRFEEGRGPVIEQPVRTARDVAELVQETVETSLGNVSQGIALLKESLDVPLIGFCGGPFTIASYLIEGGSSHDLKRTKQWMYRDPESFHCLLDKITSVCIDYLRLQLEAGVDAIQVFDSWAHVLSYKQFEEFSLAYLSKIRRSVNRPITLFCRGASLFADQLLTLDPAAISLDWNCRLWEQRKRLGPRVALQGNLDPYLLFAPQETIRREVNDLLDHMWGDPGFILGLGHGILPETPLESVETLMDCLRQRAMVEVG
jgi:uroporphyrinogen decarboxylase